MIQFKFHHLYLEFQKIKIQFKIVKNNVQERNRIVTVLIIASERFLMILLGELVMVEWANRMTWLLLIRMSYGS